MHRKYLIQPYYSIFLIVNSYIKLKAASIVTLPTYVNKQLTDPSCPNILRHATRYHLTNFFPPNYNPF